MKNRALIREGEAPAEPVRESRVLSDPARQEPRSPRNERSRPVQMLSGICEPLRNGDAITSRSPVSTARKRVVSTTITRLRVVLFSKQTAAAFPRPMNNPGLAPRFRKT